MKAENAYIPIRGTPAADLDMGQPEVTPVEARDLSNPEEGDRLVAEAGSLRESRW